MLSGATNNPSNKMIPKPYKNQVSFLICSLSKYITTATIIIPIT
jgi:hypothetical protein